MKLTVLTDNNTFIDLYLLGEPAASYYIEDEGEKILLDTGYSDVYLRNAKELGISLEELDAVVISHGHDDHTRGLKWFPRTDGSCRLIAHPDAFDPKANRGLSTGSPFTAEELATRFDLTLSRDPVRVSGNITFLGEIPRVTDFEGRPVGKRFYRGEWIPDALLDDSALVYEGKEGIYIITGCSHSGICNIILRAKELFGGRKIMGVIGGFHLLGSRSEQMEKTAEFLKNEDIPQLYPCHCTSLAARCLMDRLMPVNEAGSGLTLEWE